MSNTFAKLNLKDEKEIVVLDAPASFQKEVAGLEGTKVIQSLAQVRQFAFAIAFATEKAVLDRLAKALASKGQGDAKLWFAYPKATSKRFKCDYNRDNGWDVIRGAGWDSVRQVAIDDDWSALRFRRQEFIKNRK